MCKSDCIHSSFTNINGFSKYSIGIFGNMEYSLMDNYSDLREKRSEIIKLKGCRIFFYSIFTFNCIALKKYDIVNIVEFVFSTNQSENISC